jgi:hypothetical protein
LLRHVHIFIIKKPLMIRILYPIYHTWFKI